MEGRAGRLAVGAVLLAAAACDAGPAGPIAPSRAPAPVVQEVAGDGAALAPGRYTFSSFQPQVFFTLGEGFEGGHTNPEFFDVFKGDGALAFASPGYLLDAAGKRIDTAAMPPARALEVLRARGALSQVATTTVTVAGDEVPAIEGVARAAGTKVLGGPGGELGLDLGDRYRFAPVQVRDRLVIVIQQARELPHVAALALTDPVLGTIAFTP